MGSSSLASFIGRLRRLVEPRGGGLDDAELLERFVRQRDEAAFEVLLWRYGPLVLSVCRRMLRREQDVEDAFQATFLTMVRKVGSIARREALAGWLHQVAYRVGLRARAGIARGGIQDQEGIENAADPTGSGDNGLRELLDQEVQRLPRRYRIPLILCYLDGKTNEEAARLLACPPGTIASRLAWARQRMRTRLAARGLEAPATVTSVIVPAEMRAGSLPALVATALRTSRLVATGTLAGSGSVPVHVIVWSKGVLRAMFLSKIQWAASFVLASVLIGTGGGIVWQRVQAEDVGPDRSTQPAAQVPEKPEKKAKVAPPSADSKSAANKQRLELEADLKLLRDEYLARQDKWDHILNNQREDLWQSQQRQQRDKLRLALELKRLKKALEVAEARLEKQESILEDEWSNLEINSKAMSGKQLDEYQKAATPGILRIKKKLHEAQDQVARASAKVVDCEMALLQMDVMMERGKLRIERMERERAREINEARQKVEWLERKLYSPARDTSDLHLQEMENKLDALTRAVDELRKSMRRQEAR